MQLLESVDLTLFAEETLLHAGPHCHFGAVHVGPSQSDVYARRRFVSAQAGAGRALQVPSVVRRYWRCRGALQRMPQLGAAELALRRVGLPAEVRRLVLQRVLEGAVGQPAVLELAPCEEEGESVLRVSDSQLHLFFSEQAGPRGWAQLEAVLGRGELAWLLLLEEEDEPGTTRRFVAPAELWARVCEDAQGCEWREWPSDAPHPLLQLLAVLGASEATVRLARQLLEGTVPLHCVRPDDRPAREQVFWAM
jgi:hypothetical protein